MNQFEVDFHDGRVKNNQNLSQIVVSQTITPSEKERVEREMRVAKSSLVSPPQQLPQPFFVENVPMPGLGQKISNLTGVEGVDKVKSVGFQALPSVGAAESIFELASKPPILSNLEGEEKEKSNPNLAREIMKLGIGMEGFQTTKLAGFKKEGDKDKEKINLLLSLSTHLPKLTSEDVAFELKEGTLDEIVKVHEKLKAEGIDLFPGITLTTEMTKEDLAGAISLINHHIDVCRTHLQELFTTKISVVIQFLSMMGEVMKKVAEKDDQAKRKANQLQH